MADPLSVTASILAVVTASVVSIRSLKKAVERYRGRDETLQRLLGQLDDLIIILEALEQFAQGEASMLALLKGPVERCRQLCHEFEKAVEDFAGKSKTGFRDWTKLEFMKGNINEFMDTLSGYKSTISVGLGTVTLQTSTSTQDILQRYSEMVLDTTYNLNVNLQRINEKIERFPSEEPVTSSTYLKDERTVIEHCIHICEEAMSHISSLDDRERRVYSDALSEQAATDAASYQPKLLQVHQETRQVLQGSRDNIARFLGRLQERLQTLTSDGHPDREQQRAQLKEDIKALEDGLEVCKIASSEVNRQKIHSFGEIVAEGDSDQVVVTTWADLFTVKKAISKGNSAQLIGSMAGEELIRVSRDRYSSRFGAVDISQVDVRSLPTHTDRARVPGQGADEQQQQGLSGKANRAAPNEVRKRTTDIYSRP